MNIGQYKSIKELKQAILCGYCKDSDLLDWEFEECISDWLKEVGEDSISDLLRGNMKSINGEQAQFAFILQVLDFSETEIVDLMKGSYISEGNRNSNKIQTIEDLTERLGEMEKRLSLVENQVVPIGTLSLFPSHSIPNGWLPCEGQSISKDFFKKLYLRIGNAVVTNTENELVLPDMLAHGLGHGLRYCIYTGEQVIPYDTSLVKAPKKRFIRVNGISIEMVQILSFYISKSPVDFDLWLAIMGEKLMPKENNTYPGVRINQWTIETFLKKINEYTCLSFRIPTYIEWKYAIDKKDVFGLNAISEDVKEWCGDRVPNVGWPVFGSRGIRLALNLY